MNIRFAYLYRDAGNYKNRGTVVFANPHGLRCEEVAARMRAVLITQAWFVAPTAQVPDLHFQTWDPEEDHGWHEFDACEPTDEDPNDPAGRTVEEFIDSLRVASRTD